MIRFECAPTLMCMCILSEKVCRMSKLAHLPRQSRENKNTKAHRPRNEQAYSSRRSQKNKKQTFRAMPKAIVPKPIGHEMSIFLETVPENPKIPKISELLRKLKRAYFSIQSKKTKAHRPRTKHIHRDNTEKAKKIQSCSKGHFSRQPPKTQTYHKGHRPRNEHIPRDSPKKQDLALFQRPFLETVSIACHLCCFWTVSKNMLMFWPMGFGILGCSGTVSRNMHISDL